MFLSLRNFISNMANVLFSPVQTPAAGCRVKTTEPKVKYPDIS